MDQQDVSFLIKTMFRPNSLKRLLLSIRNRYPLSPIHVGDDNYDKYPEISYEIDSSSRMHHHLYPEDHGIGRVLNDILTKVTTKYIVLLEDDFEFTELTRIETLVGNIESGLFDISGGACRSFEKGSIGGFQGFFDWSKYPMAPGPYEFADMNKVVSPTKFDTIVNFFVARTEDIIPFGWSEELKVARHVHFFLMSGGWRPKLGPVPTERRLITGYDPSVEIIHHSKEIEDAKFRRPRGDHRTRRQPEFKQMYLDLWGFTMPEGAIPVT